MSAGRGSAGASPGSGRPPLSGSPLAVLFVDPDLEGAERLARSLPNVSAIAVVPTARAAFMAIDARVPDLIVTELDLPDASGVEMLARIHSAPATRRVLLIVLTRRNAVRDKVAAFEAGADDYLVKPVTPERLATHVRLVSRFRLITST
jgi:DNA-binding response OmpR family regulator